MSNDSLENFRAVREDTLANWPQHLTEPLIALPKRTRQALGMVVDLMLLQLIEWQKEGRIDQRGAITSLDDIIEDLQMLANLTDDESKFDGSDPDYDKDGWLLIDPMDPAFPRWRLKPPSYPRRKR